MEFFRVLANSNLDKNKLKSLLTIENLPKLCKSIDSVIADNGTSGVIYCVWGEFEINREELHYGIRFSLPNCPNALAWSITTDKDSTDTVIYCTINKKEQDELFIDTIIAFIEDWKYGLGMSSKIG